ncbi:FG-GAP repeat domain-containing protein [Streptomyces sp. NPDC059491]|uniref:FG-GAP repeat domain-containing protein n=1 Tax=Streptomyces sp. NPDC059491 TaxID=3346850 RepID=UPI0036A768D9
MASSPAYNHVLAPFGQGDDLVSLGRTGALSWDAEDPNLARWTRFADGTTTAFPRGHFVFGSRDSDLVIDQSGDVVTVKDMEAGKDVHQVDVASAGPGAAFAGAVRSHVFVSTRNAAGTGEDLHVYAPGETGAAPSKRTVTGLPADATRVFAVGAAGDDVLVAYGTGGHTTRWAILDLATATVTASRDMGGAGDRNASPVLSATHVAWARFVGGDTVVNVLERATGKVQLITLAGTGDITLGLVGKWVTYARTGGLLDTSADPQNAVTARDLYGPATRRLLDHAVSGIDAPGDATGVLGGTVTGGEGVYRIAPGADGAPVATQVAATGAPTKVTLLGHNVPARLDLDRTGGRFTLNWRLSRTNVDLVVKLRNNRTGETVTENALPPVDPYDPHVLSFAWQGELRWNDRPDMTTAASNGPYTWEITGTPRNGIGPVLRASGAFTVTRRSGAHDFDTDGSPDVFARDTTGRLWMHDTYKVNWADQLNQNPRQLVSGGWQIYDRIEAAGNLGGSPVNDLVARDRSGVLWLYKGTGDPGAPLADRTRIGGGWGVYDRLAAGSDFTGDGRPDLLATDKTGVLWLYPATGNANAPFSGRKRVGGGWGVYNDLTAVGNMAGAAAGDLVARDRSGVLWLYLGRGDGTIAPRIRVGAGWQGFGHVVGLGDADRDGRPDLYAAASGTYAHAGLYRGTGDWKRPLRSPVVVAGYVTLPDVTFDLYV